MSKIRLFDPTGLKPDDYRHRYPELEREPVFAELSASALIFVWWYINQSSPLVMEIPDDYERVAEALKRSKYNPSKAERENILRLQFDTGMAEAIKKMSEYLPSMRYQSYKMIANIFNHYQDVIKQGPTAFVTTEGRGDNKVEYTDYARYVTTSARIAEEIPNLLVRLEEGFGILNIQGEEIVEEGGASSLREWQRAKENKET
jgi:hypothetical protein